MKNLERIKTIKQFIDLAEGKAADGDTSADRLACLIVVLTAHIRELCEMLDEPKEGYDVNLDAALQRALFGPAIPREEPKPLLTTDYDEYGMFSFAPDQPYTGDLVEFTANVILPWANKTDDLERQGTEEPTADEVLKHTKSCDFRRGLKVCTCISK